MRKGVSKTGAAQLMRNHNYFAAMMVRSGDADAMISGMVEPYVYAARPILQVLGTKENQILSGIYIMVVDKKFYFLSDCTINATPNAHELAEIANTTAHFAQRYCNDEIRVAMLSFSSFGASNHAEARKVSDATNIIRASNPDYIVDGEMQADVALSTELQEREFPFCALNGKANVLIFPNLTAANISSKLLSHLTNAKLIGPILVGVNKPANILHRSASVEDIVNMAYMTTHKVVRK